MFTVGVFRVSFVLGRDSIATEMGRGEMVKATTTDDEKKEVK